MNMDKFVEYLKENEDKTEEEIQEIFHQIKKRSYFRSFLTKNRSNFIFKSLNNSILYMNMNRKKFKIWPNFFSINIPVYWITEGFEYKLISSSYFFSKMIQNPNFLRINKFSLKKNPVIQFYQYLVMKK